MTNIHYYYYTHYSVTSLHLASHNKCVMIKDVGRFTDTIFGYSERQETPFLLANFQRSHEHAHYTQNSAVCLNFLTGSGAKYSSTC